jgi:hypothetical protein
MSWSIGLKRGARQATHRRAPTRKFTSHGRELPTPTPPPAAIQNTMQHVLEPQRQAWVESPYVRSLLVSQFPFPLAPRPSPTSTTTSTSTA